jgi:hypothetical protein
VGDLRNGAQPRADRLGTHGVAGMGSSKERSAKSRPADHSITGREETNHGRRTPSMPRVVRDASNDRRDRVWGLYLWAYIQLYRAWAQPEIFFGGDKNCGDLKRIILCHNTF